jgi:hypothetical protein
MAFTLDLWQVISFIGMLITAFFVLFKLLMSQQLKQIDAGFKAQTEALEAQNKRLDRIEQAGREEGNNWNRIEREILTLKADLPVNYVRREDYVANIATIMTKLDAMSMRFENILLRGLKNNE